MSLVGKHPHDYATRTTPGNGRLPAGDKFLQSLSDDELEAAHSMLTDPSWTTSAIHRAFLEEGMSPVHERTFREWRVSYLRKVDA